MRHLLPILLIFSLLAGPHARAQRIQRADTSAFRATQLIAPGVLIASGVGVHCWGHDAIDVPVNQWFQEKWRAGGPERSFDNYIQYVPITGYVGLGLLGVPAKHAFTDRMIQGAISCAALGIISLTCKELINSPSLYHPRRDYPRELEIYLKISVVRRSVANSSFATVCISSAVMASMRRYKLSRWRSIP